MYLIIQVSFRFFYVNIMQYEGIKILFCDNQIDTTTVREAIYSDEEFVEVVACDTDILCLLLHHMTLLDVGESIFMNSMKLSKSSDQHVTSSIQNVEKDQIHEQSLLFAHTFGECNTKSSINRLWKFRFKAVK